MAVAAREAINGSTTVMANESEEVSAQRDRQMSITSALLERSDAGYDQMAVARFLAKPRIVSRFDWSSTDPEPTVLTAIDLPGTLFTGGPWEAKLQGFMAIRGTFRVTVQVNAQPFQAGRLLLCYVPQGDMDINQSNYRANGLLRASQLPGVQLDPLHQSEVSLDVPYVAPTTHYPLRLTGTARFSWARVYLLVYSQLRSAAASTAGVTIWVSLRDVELITPTIEYQSGFRRVKRVTRNVRTRVPEKEAEDVAEGPISGALRTISEASAVVGTIPFLSQVAVPVSWATGVASRVAAAFGYDKPRVVENAQDVTLKQGSFFYSGHGPDTATPLAAMGSNQVEVLPGFAGCDIDETGLTYVASIPAFFNHFAWGVSDQTDALVFRYALNPTAFKTFFTSGNSIVSQTPLSFVASLFTYWRGSICITIKVVRTKFHTGRLAVTFIPIEGVEGTDPAPNPPLSNPLPFREVIDLAENNSEWTFQFPYCSVHQYLRSRAPEDFRTGAGTNWQFYGHVQVSVLNPLRAPATVANAVDVIVEVHGGEDFEFAVPRAIQAVPLVSDSSPDVLASGTDIEYQAGQLGVSAQVPIASAGSHQPSVVSAKYCIGEKVMSLRHLGHRYSAMRLPSSPGSVFGFYYSAFGGGPSAYDPATPTLPAAFGGTIQDIIRACYRYARGSVNVCILRHATPLSTAPVAGFLLDEPYGDPTFSTGAPTTVGALEAQVNAPLALQAFPIPAFEVAVPYYSPTPVSMIWLGRDATTRPGIGQPRTRLAITQLFSSATIAISESFGDDFQLGFWLGAPVLCVTTILT